jgi:catalase-peroxidase
VVAALIVLGGTAPVEADAKKAARHAATVSFSPGRTDASQALTDAHSFAPLEPVADGFRNYVRKGHEAIVAELLIDKANLLTLTAGKTAVLFGGLRALDTNVGQAKHGVFTKRADELSNDFFVNLLDMNTKWQKSADAEFVLEGRDR